MSAFTSVSRGFPFSGEDVRLSFDEEGKALQSAADVPEVQPATGGPSDAPERFEVTRLWGGNAPFGIWDNEQSAFCQKDDYTLQFVEQGNAKNFLKGIQQANGQKIFPEPSMAWVSNPIALYRQALLMLDRAVGNSSLSRHLRDRDLDYSAAQDALGAEMSQLMNGAMTSYPEIKAAYQLLPMFREWLIEDILERYYQDVPDGLDAPVRHASDPGTPNWLKEVLSVPGAEHSGPKQEGGNTPAPPVPEAVPDPTGAGVPEQPENDDDSSLFSIAPSLAFCQNRSSWTALPSISKMPSMGMAVPSVRITRPSNGSIFLIVPTAST